MSLGNLPRVIGKKPSLGYLNSLRWLFASWPIVGLLNVRSYSKFSTYRPLLELNALAAFAGKAVSHAHSA